MGFLRNLFRKEEEDKSTFDYERMVDGLDERRRQPSSEQKHFYTTDQAEQELVDCCERMMERIHLLKDEKHEYDVDTSYLQDTEILDGLDEKDKRELADTAGAIVNLNNNKKLYKDWKSKDISQDRMNEFDRVRDDIPDAIARLKSNESYQSIVKRDMQKLEEERNLWGYERSRCKKSLQNTRKGLIVMTSIFIACVVIMGMVTLVMGVDMTIPLCAAGILVVGVAFFLYLRQQTSERDLKQAEVNLNRAIELLNQMKTRYVGITNAVNYAYDKYRVHKSSELEYLYNEYLKVSRERDQYERMNTDLEYYNRVLVRQLNNYHLYDASIWVYQPLALVNPKEMVEVRHSLIEHRQGIRDRMDVQMVEIRKEYEEIRKLIGRNPEFKDEVQDILKVVEQLMQLY